jgi:hypothetical protein
VVAAAAQVGRDPAAEAAAAQVGREPPAVPAQSFGQKCSTRIEHVAPVQPPLHLQTPLLVSQLPRPVQPSGQVRSEQSSPDQGSRQRQTMAAKSQDPWKLQSFLQARGGNAGMPVKVSAPVEPVPQLSSSPIR